MVTFSNKIRIDCFCPKLETRYGTALAYLTNCLKVIIVWSEQDVNKKEQ